MGGRVDAVFLLGYSTITSPRAVGKERWLRNRQSLRDLSKNAGATTIQELSVDPYSFQSMQDALEQAVGSTTANLVIIDISCITKIHTLALAAALSGSIDRFNWTVAYSIPELYQNLQRSQKVAGWRDIIVAPLAETALLLNEAYSRGIVITGHEADRLIVALGELEPSGGLILMAETPRRPDLRHLSERKNQRVIRQLTSMRASNWKKRVVGLFDFERLSRLVAEEISSAESKQAPVIVFPYGPKCLLFQTALQLSSDYPQASWFVVPIPVAYDVNYSEGADRTVWLVPCGADVAVFQSSM